MEMVLSEVFQGRHEQALLPSEIAPSECSERELASRVAAGDMGAFEEVYRRYQRNVYSLCLRMTHNVAEAEDLTHDIFVALFDKLGSFRGDSALMTWIHRVTVNLVLMHFRKASVRREETTEDGFPPFEKSVQNAEALSRQPVERLALERAIACLPPGYRAVLILHDVEGYEHEEIGRMCGISAGTSKSQLHKARVRLRRLLVATNKQSM
jgi:RNA polymerase sigma-70 factor, ECF subfamily